MEKKRQDFSIAYFIVALAVIFFAQYLMLAKQIETISYSQFKTLLRGGQVTDIVVRDKTITGQIKPEGLKEVFSEDKLKQLAEGAKKSLPFFVVRGDDPRLTAELEEAGIPFQGETSSDWLPTILSWVVPIVIFFVVWSFLINRMGGTGGGLMQIGKSKAKVYIEKQTGVSFADVAGIDEAEAELVEVVEFLKHPEKYQRLGGHLPKGVLLVGPPGTGKTLLARAVAGEAGVPFFSISGSDFVEMFVGVGASRVRDLFEQAKQAAPCIVFMDEIDAVGRHRGAGLGGGHDEREQTLNQLLVEMDGFDTNEGVILVAATNRPDVLDPALLRPGRFDRRVVVDNPDSKGRRAILDVHARGKPLAEDVNLELLAKHTPGFSGADLANLVNEAALLAARRNKKKITMDEMDEAIERVIAGPQRRSRILSPREREIAAFHEGGHALLGKLLPNADPPHKVTILPRGMALGYVISAPPEDKYTYTRTELLDRITAALGGRVSEELVFNEITTGAQNDFEQATDLARRMVTEFGMSDKLGPLSLGKRHGPVFLGRDLVETRNYSEEIAYEIDKEVRRIIDECYDRARTIITDNRDKLDRVAKALLERESLEGDDLERVLAGEALAPESPPAPPEVRPEPTRTEKPEKSLPALKPKPEAS